MTNKIAIAILLGSFVIAMAILLNTAIDLITNKSKPSTDPQKIYENISFINTAGSPYLGNPSAKVTVIEYIDFECPICKKVYNEIMPQLTADYIKKNKVKFVFKSLPIDSLHLTAFVKTEAAFCAYAQKGNSAFFSFHDIFFSRSIPGFGVDINDELVNIARELNLDTVKFSDCLTRRTYKPLIEKEKIEALTINANGTPTWLIGRTAPKGRVYDTVKLNGLHKYEIYKTIIDQLLTNE